MASNHTAAFGLNQWAATDPVLREDFNADNQKIEAAMKAIQEDIPNIYLGEYTGTGTYGEQAPNTLTFPFVPKLVLISNYQAAGSRKNVVGWFYGYTAGAIDNDVNTATVTLTWSGKTLTWYSSSSASYQLNQNNITYRYCVIG